MFCYDIWLILTASEPVEQFILGPTKTIHHAIDFTSFFSFSL